MLKLIGFGFLTGRTPYGNNFDHFQLEDFRGLGYTETEANSLKQKLAIAVSKGVSVIDSNKRTRSDKFDSPMHLERNSFFLYYPFILLSMLLNAISFIEFEFAKTLIFV
jgi:hypothetical protein